MPSDRAGPTLFLCGDVMTGRGVDQVLPHPGAPRLHERWVTSALGYVDLAEEADGPIPRGAGFDYVWGDALAILDRIAPDARIVNLETSITTSEAAEPKGINYRMHPANAGVLTAARIDCCVLANNHVLDWGTGGLEETLETLERLGVATAGAGRDLASARAPAVLGTRGSRRVLVFAFGLADSGIPPHWGAGIQRPGVELLPDLSDDRVPSIGERVARAKRDGDIAVASVHWGSNWGFEIPDAHRRFAHALIDHAAIDIVHGHSSHHVRAIEVHRGRPIFYGCGDFLNDYEGIRGHERYRADLAVMYFPTMDAAGGELAALRMVPLRIRRFRLERADAADRAWLEATLHRECRRFGYGVASDGDELALVYP